MRATAPIMRILLVTAICILTHLTICSAAETTNQRTGETNHAASTIVPGTVITMGNWQRYKAFMPDGMAALFEGKYFWKMPPDVRMEVGSTVIRPLPKNYTDATDKYAQGVRAVELSGGGVSLENYHGGIPFPSPF
jgi:hypothetical protein